MGLNNLRNNSDSEFRKNKTNHKILKSSRRNFNLKVSSIYVYVQLNHFAAYLTPMQPYKSTILQCVSVCINIYIFFFFKGTLPEEYGKIENIKLHLS